MKKTPIIIISAFVFVAVAAAGYLKFQKSDESIVRTEDTSISSGLSTSQVQQNNQPAQTSTVSSAGYVEYQDGIIAKTAGKKVLFFHAPWCKQCRSIEAGINEQGVPEGFTIIKVDYDSHQDLRKKYGVKLQTTFVKIDDSGAKTDLYVAYDEPTFDSVKRNFIN